MKTTIVSAVVGSLAGFVCALLLLVWLAHA